MTLDELIAKLVAVHDTVGGDATVSRWNTCCCYGDFEKDLTEVEVQQNDGYPPYVVLS
ncbi:hypothetical protein PBI_MISSWHITE_35 [Mycobacterium phage MissWhite]|nr:hypothetical protein PBI_MISSWHITE_35 [Mycobacterium phage MissWhite]